MSNNTTGSENVAVGDQALSGNLGGNLNIAVGRHALTSASYGNKNIAIGHLALAQTKADSNIAIGSRAGDNIDWGNNNIIIGNNIDMIFPNANNRLNIGNAIFGTGLNGTGTTVSNALIGINQSNPLYHLDVQGMTRISPPTALSDFLVSNTGFEPTLTPTIDQYGYVGTSNQPHV